jgi:hypothetical protein
MLIKNAKNVASLSLCLLGPCLFGLFFPEKLVRKKLNQTDRFLVSSYHFQQ